MSIHSEEFDNLFNQIEHYHKFPAMRPFIGKHYGLNGSIKLLLIAESNYLPEESTIHQKANFWYNSEQKDLNKEEIKWINCRELCQCDWKPDGHMIYRELNKVLSEYFNTNLRDEKAISNVAFMNGFQRPSPKSGDSIKPYLTDIDKTISAAVISQVISVINPDLVIFVSKLAWDSLRWRLKIEDKNIVLDYTCHPATGGLYWNRKDYKHGKEKLRSILTKMFKEIRIK